MKINDLGFNNAIDTTKIQRKNVDIENKEDKELMDACKEFESIFLYMMMKEMKKTVPRDGLIERSSASDTFEDMYLEEMSKEISKDENSLGFARQMYDSFKMQKRVKL